MASLLSSIDQSADIPAEVSQLLIDFEDVERALDSYDIGADQMATQGTILTQLRQTAADWLDNLGPIAHKLEQLLEQLLSQLDYQLSVIGHHLPIPAPTP